MEVLIENQSMKVYFTPKERAELIKKAERGADFYKAFDTEGHSIEFWLILLYSLKHPDVKLKLKNMLDSWEVSMPSDEKIKEFGKVFNGKD